MSAWQPISTLPANGERVFLWCTEAGDDHKGALVFGRRHERSKTVRGDGMTGDWTFSHWMPLPEPPKDRSCG